MSHKKSWSRVQDYNSYRETMERLYPDKRPVTVEPQPQPPVEEQPEIEATQPPCNHEH